MLHYPNVMRKAQAELDAVVGRERVPTFEDKDSLPYIRAVIRETLRWRPIAPLGALHHVVRTICCTHPFQVFHIEPLK